MTTKQRLIQEIAEAGVTHKRARQILDDVNAGIKNCLARGETVKIQNFGRFEVREHKGREMVNPRTGDTHEIDSRKVVYFRPSENFISQLSDSS